MDLYQKLGLAAGSLFVGLGFVVVLSFDGAITTAGAIILGGYGVLVAGLAFRRSRQKRDAEAEADFSSDDPLMGGESVATVADSDETHGPEAAGDGVDAARRATDRTSSIDTPSDE
jgi:hypothetical protein